MPEKISVADNSSKAIKGVTSLVINIKRKRKHVLIIREQQEVEIESLTHDDTYAVYEAYLTRWLSARENKHNNVSLYS